jgi:hypothetical protein
MTADQPQINSDERRYSIDADRAVWREVGDEVVILDVPTGTYLSLNGSGRLLWKKLDGGATAGDLTGELVAAYDIDAEQAHADVVRFLDALTERSLLAAVG